MSLGFRTSGVWVYGLGFRVYDGPMGYGFRTEVL